MLRIEWMHFPPTFMKPLVNFSELKKFFLFTLVGSLIVAAVISVITVLIGTFGTVTWRVFLTLFMVIVHALASLVFIWDDSRRDTFDRLAFFANVAFVIIVLSFVTSIFGIWNILSAHETVRLYSMYFLLGFASLHGDMLSKAMKRENYLDSIVVSNYVFIAIVVVMLLPIIYIDHPIEVLGGLYLRFLAAAAIIDGTLSILTILFYKLYLHKHPKAEDITQSDVAVTGKVKRRGLSVWLWILLIYLLVQVIVPLFWLGASAFRFGM